MRQAPTSWWPFADGSAADGWRSLALVLTAVGLGALGLLFLFESRLLPAGRCARFSRPGPSSSSS